MADETNEPTVSTDTPVADAGDTSVPTADAGATSSDAATSSNPDETGEAGQKHGLKQDLREGVAKVVGYTVEVASILGQQGGPAVEAERDIAEANTEQFIDRIDGED